jgi:hypothetical protein
MTYHLKWQYGRDQKQYTSGDSRLLPRRMRKQLRTVAGDTDRECETVKQKGSPILQVRVVTRCRI